MKLLVDENISYRVIDSIISYFPNSVHVSNIIKGKITDLEIWDYAKINDYVIVTYDQDFYEWQQLKGFPPYVVWLRFGNAPTNYIAKKLTLHKQQIIELATEKQIGILEIH